VEECSAPAVHELLDEGALADAGGAGDHHGVAPRAAFESKFPKRFIVIQLQAHCSRRFQRGFDGVILHRPTTGLGASSCVGSLV